MQFVSFVSKSVKKRNRSGLNYSCCENNQRHEDTSGKTLQNKNPIHKRTQREVKLKSVYAK